MTIVSTIAKNCNDARNCNNVQTHLNNPDVSNDYHHGSCHEGKDTYFHFTSDSK